MEDTVYTYHEKGAWYYGLLISGATIAFKLEDEAAYKDAVAGKPFLAYHCLLFHPRNPIPDYLAAKGGTVDPWIVNGSHFISINKLTKKYNDQVDEMMQKTVEALNKGPSIIQHAPATALPPRAK